MINIFNRREVLITRDMAAMSQTADRLNAAGIGVQVRTGTLASAGRSHGIPGIRAESAYEYRIYVHRRDYERAKSLMRQQ